MFFERPSEPSKPGTPGWHNSAAFHQFAQAEGLYARSINGDAFSDEIKRVIEAIRADLGQVDQDWQMWIDALLRSGVLAEGATTAFTYLGERITHDIYWNGSIGAAEGPGPQGAGHPRQAGGARRRRPRVGAQGRRHRPARPSP